MDWTGIVWMGGMTIIAIAVERRTARLEKKLDERQNEACDAAKVPYQPNSSAMQRDKRHRCTDSHLGPSEQSADDMAGRSEDE